MLVSWKWLQDYVDLGMSREEAEDRLAMSGLNHEGTETVGDDFAVDLEVTSNRADCLGHIGVAREIAVLYDQGLCVSDPQPTESGSAVNDHAKVTVDTSLCNRYTARVIRGVKIGPSPEWLVERLATVGLPTINNVADITNYVLMECGQPLHAFDLAKISGGEIIVREALEGETLEAIDHKEYPLDPGMCVIADAKRPIALGGVMGGAGTEVGDETVDVLIEAADFDQLSVRTTARKLKLHSDSSYRFERGVDPKGIDWASRRCCDLILDLAGGELAKGVIDHGDDPTTEREPIVLRLSQIQRILGIEVPTETVRKILTALGHEELGVSKADITCRPPTWRKDLTREIDLIEEVARIYGYEKIPEDANVPMAASHRSDLDRTVEKVRGVLNGAGFDEAMTISLAPAKWSNLFSPWTQNDPVRVTTAMIKGADELRRSIVPSLLNARRDNQAAGNAEVELFEIAKIYLPQGESLPHEPWMVALTSGKDFRTVKGVIESVVDVLNPGVSLTVASVEDNLLDPQRSCVLLWEDKPVGYLGEVSPAGAKHFKLRSSSTIAEIDLSALASFAKLVPQQQSLSEYPAITQDLNFIVAESLPWSELVATVQSSAGDDFESAQYVETYRDAKADGKDRKRVLLSFTLRSKTRTLTSDAAEAARNGIVAACKKKHDAELVG